MAPPAPPSTTGDRYSNGTSAPTIEPPSASEATIISVPAPGGVKPSIRLVFTNLGQTSSLPSKVITVVAARKFSPTMVMGVNPVAGPKVGLTSRTIGGGRYVNGPVSFAVAPPAVTVTAVGPAAWG